MLLPSGYCRGNSYMVLVPVLSSRSLCNSWFVKLKLRHSCDNLSDLSKLPESQWRYFKAVFTGRMIPPMLCDFGKINRWKPPFGLISSLSADIQAVSMYSITLHKSRCSNIAFSETAGLPKKTFSHLNPWVSVASSCSDAATKWKNLGKLLVCLCVQGLVGELQSRMPNNSHFSTNNYSITVTWCRYFRIVSWLLWLHLFWPMFLS